jgi:hypothetical protein
MLSRSFQSLNEFKYDVFNGLCQLKSIATVCYELVDEFGVFSTRNCCSVGPSEVSLISSH